MDDRRASVERRNMVRAERRMSSERRDQLTKDMQYLRVIYGWSDEEVIEIREAAKEDCSWWDYWTEMARAWRSAEAGEFFHPDFSFIVRDDERH